jgi:hypothetical protein
MGFADVGEGYVYIPGLQRLKDKLGGNSHGLTYRLNQFQQGYRPAIS